MLSFSQNDMATISYHERQRIVLGRILVWPAALWLIIFFALPLVIVLLYSILTPDSVYQVRGPLTLNNYL